jgi:hypothetical protein
MTARELVGAAKTVAVPILGRETHRNQLDCSKSAPVMAMM